jgi:acyl-CoA synthetase (NDP forming)/RimJ/RimL family protein N-acetyltransferase
VTDAPEPVPPPHWEADVIAADGGTVHLRAIRASDADALVTFHAGLSTRTRYLRYFSAYPRIPERDLQRFVHVDHHDRVALVVLLGREIIAVGRYERAAGTDQAEVAFVVADAHQGRGIGSVLLEHLAAAARECGIRVFTAIVLAENTRMMGVFRRAGYESTRHLDHGEVELEFPVAETETTAAVMREREQRAEARSIRRLLYPRSVAVVGASNDPGKVGHATFTNLLRAGFDGPLYPVNPDARHVRGVPAYRSVLDVPGELDLVVIAVPAAAVPEVVQQCAARGVRGLVVLSGGFGERGPDEQRAVGRAALRELVSAARANGMRVVGPNCLGVINTDPAVGLNASLAPLTPLRGRAGFFAQSGALGVAVLGEAARRGIGVSTFVSAGSRADVSGNDLMQYWETDERTDVVLMYLESFGNPRKFARLARRLGRSKPIIAVNSAAGTVVAGLETTASVVLPEATARALFERSGVIRVDTVGELFDTALLLTSQPLPDGPRVAVVGNSTALAVLVRNACAADGLSLERVEDVGVDAAPEEFEAAVRTVLADDGVDAVVAVFVPPLRPASEDDVALALRRGVAGSPKPVVSTFLGFEGVPGALNASGDTSPAPGSVPSYTTPERAVRALARAVRHAAWRRRPRGTVPELGGVDIDAARAVAADVLARDPDGRALSDDEAGRLIGAVGLILSHEVPPESVEVALGVHDDPSFGALASFGVAGVAIELLGDRAYAPVPLTSADAEELVDAPRAAPLLRGYGGIPPMDRHAVQELLLRLSALADAVPELAECTLHALATPIGAQLRSVRARVAPAAARADTGPRRMRGL